MSAVEHPEQPDALCVHEAAMTNRELSHRLFDLGALLKRPRDENEAVIRSLSQTAYLGNDRALCRTLGRYKTFVDTNDIGMASHLMLDGYWEMWVTEAIASLVRPGMMAADIGANVGYFSLLLSDLVGPEGMVHAFEPNPMLVGPLLQTLAINGFGPRTRVHQIALGETTGDKMVFLVPPNEPKNGYMYPLKGELPPDGIMIETVRLDSRDEWAAIEFAKIDVEGAEELVWSGAAGLLDGGKLRTVVLEFTPGRYRDARAFLDKILAYGFSLEMISPTRGIVSATREEVLGGNPREDIMLLLRR